MGFRLDVPYVRQLNIGGHVPGNTESWDDPTGCWYASVCMVGYFFGQGPRLGVPEIFNRAHPKHTQHQAIGKDWQDRLLIQREGLEVVPGSDTVQNYTTEQIQRLLEAKGPILFYWTKTTYGHASVVVGVAPSRIIYHDPEFRNNGGKDLQMPIARLNSARLFKTGVYGLLQRARITERDLLTIRSKSPRSVAALRQRFGG